MNGVLESPEARQSRRDHVRERKRQLEEELRTIQQQRAQLEQQLQALTSDHLALPGPAKAARPGARAPLPSQFGNVGGAAERAQIYAERERRVTALFQQCGTIHKNVKANQKALSFIEPVDPVKLKILDYFHYVKKPMALADVAGKLAHNPAKGIHRKYKTVYEFRDDMRQIWENCRIYNPIGQPVRTNGDWMSEYWEKKWAASGLEAKWEEEMLRQRQEELKLAGGPDLPRQMEEMDRELRQLQQQVDAHDGEVAAPGGRPMSFEEKRRLSQGLGTLQADRLGLVMEIIAESQGIDLEQEMEVSIDDLDQDTLWRLNAFVHELPAAGRLLQAGDAAAAGNGGSGAPSGGGAASEQDNEERRGGGREAGVSFGANRQQQSGEAAAERSRGYSDAGISEAEDDSQGEVGSKQFQGSAANHHGNKVHQSLGGDGMDFVSATVPKIQPQIIKNMANKKEVMLQNASAWATLTENPGEGGGTAGGRGAGEEGAGGDDDEDMEGGGVEEDDGDEDNLWAEFKSREENQQALDEEKKAEEERIKRERQEKEEAAAREAKERRAAAEAAAEAERQAALDKEEEERRLREEQKEKEIALLQNVEKPSDLRDQQDLFGGGHSGASMGGVFGLQLKDGSDEEGDFGDEDDEPLAAEEGEV